MTAREIRKTHYDYFKHQCDKIRNHMELAQTRKQHSQVQDLKKKLEHYEAAAYALRPYRSKLEVAVEEFRDND